MERINEVQRYRFIYRTGMGELIDVRAGCRPGDAERRAKTTAREVARRLKETEVICIWMGPEGKELPRQLIEEARA